MSKEKVVLPSDNSVQEALNAIRGPDVGPSAWVVIGYTDAVTLGVVAQGSGSLAEAAEHFPPKDIRYCLIRKEHKVELANTVKFAYVCWSPDTIAPTRKAVLATHKGQVQAIFTPFHVFMECSERRDLDEQELMNKIGFSSGTASFVTDKQASVVKGGAVGSAAPRPSLKEGGGGPSLPGDAQKEGALNLADGDAIPNALAAVKSDKDPTDWCLVGYANATTLKLLGQGEGGVEELASKLDDGQVYYGYFRVTEQVDQSTTVKFGFLNLMSQKVPTVLRAKISTHRGFVTKLFSPFHVEFGLSDYHDFTREHVVTKIGAYSGTKSHVTDKEETLLAGKMTTHKKTDHLVAVDSLEQITFADEQAFRAAIADVRADDTETNWVVASYVSRNQLGLVGTGTGGLQQLVDTLQDDKVNFALLRVTDQIDKSVTVKFVYIKWQPKSIAPTLRAQISTKKGLIDPLFAPFHVDFFVETRDELDQQTVMDKVTAASGSKLNVK